MSSQRITTNFTLCLACLTAAAGTLAASSARAQTLAPWWRLSSTSAPTYLQPGEKEGLLTVAASNLGDTAAKGTNMPITITDSLPQGLRAKAVKLLSRPQDEEGTCEPLPALRCTFNKDVQPYVRLEMAITVEVAEHTPQGQATNEMHIQGGEATSVTQASPLRIAAGPTPFGLASVELAPENETGAPDTQAGSHPFQLTTALTFNQTLEPEKGTRPLAPALLKNLHFSLPPGLIGDPQATPQCSNLDFATLYLQDTNLCPANTAIGVALVTVSEPLPEHYLVIPVPVFNLTPAPGEPARFGFEAYNVPVVLDTAVQTGGDYSVQVNVSSATTAAQVLGTQITLWGEPGDERHDQSRGWACIVAGGEAPEGEACEPPDPRPSTPFLRLPTSCEGPLTATLTGDSWSGGMLEGVAEVPALEGCGALAFSPSIGVQPETQAASTPSGMTLEVRVPQKGLLEAGQLGESDVRDASVVLPEGVDLSPSAANGLVACSEQQVGYTGTGPVSGVQDFSAGPAVCPEASKLGLVRIKTPLLPRELVGGVYLASPAPNGEAGENPFGSLAAVYVVAEEPVSRVLVKLAGEVSLSEGTLQATTTFADTPQVPFEELQIQLFGGPRAALSTPAFCGDYVLSGSMTPWSGGAPAALLTGPGEFAVDSGPGGSGCPSGVLPFAPGFTAQSTSLQAGAFTGFSLGISRPDGDQAVGGVSVSLPEGVAALLSSVTPCGEPQASQGACGPESLIGYTTVDAGLGGEPVSPPAGQVFLTGPYGNAPFGLSVITPAVAGPFDLGDVVVRSAISVNPETAAVTITSGPLPTQLKGIPLQLKQINIVIDRPAFEFNPTSCEPMKIEGAITGAQGTTEPVSAPFQVQGCESLPFTPTLTASAAGRGSKANGTSFQVTVQSKGLGQANIAKVDLQLPSVLSSRLPTLQKACLAAVFNTNPAGCAETSIIGSATIHTPVLAGPLTGPAYLVAHGSEFPDVEFVLQGEGITLILDGATSIKHGITYSRFETAPDAPFTRFETSLPAGPHGVLTPNVPEKENFSLCKTRPSMPTEITSQAGTTIKTSTPITIAGCKGVLPSKTHKPTTQQQLTKALQACHSKHKHNKRQRHTCEQQAKKHHTAKNVRERLDVASTPRQQ